MKKLIKYGLFIYSLFLLCATTFGQDLSDTLKAKDLVQFSFEDLMSVKVITASKSLTSVVEAPSVMSVITKKDISEQGLKTLEEVLQRIPGFFTSDGGTRSIISNRGILTNKFLLLFDGHSVNSIVKNGMFQQHIYPLLDDIERIEIIRGPGSTLWGSEAALGVINIISKSPWNETNSDEHPFGSFNANYDYASPIDRHIAKLTYSKKFGKNNGIIITGNWFKSDPEWLTRYQAGGADDSSFIVNRAAAIVHSDFNDSWEVSGKMKLGSLLISGRALNYNSMSTMLTSTGTPERYGHYDYTNSFLDAKYSFDIGDYSDLDLRVYYDHIRDYAIGDESGGASPTRFVRSEEDGIGSELIYTNNYFDKHEIKMGLQYRYVKTGHLDERRMLNDSVVKEYNWAQSGADNNIDFFAEDTWHFADKWIAVYGARLDYNDFRENKLNFLPRVGLIWKTSNRITLKSLYNTGYVRPYVEQSLGTAGAPFWIEAFDQYWVGAGKSEKINSLDFQILYNSKKVYLGVTLYYLTYEGFIGWAGKKYQSDPDYVAWFQNFNTVTSKGVEFDFNYEIIDPLSVYGNYSYTHARLESMVIDLQEGGELDITGSVWVEPGGAFTGAPEHTWNIGLNYIIIKNLNLNIHLRGWSGAWVLETRLPKYKKMGPENYVDLNLSWKNIFNSPVSLSLYCKDLFNNKDDYELPELSSTSIPVSGNITGQPTLHGVLPGYGRIIGFKLNLTIGRVKAHD